MNWLLCTCKNKGLTALRKAGFKDLKMVCREGIPFICYRDSVSVADIVMHKRHICTQFQHENKDRDLCFCMDQNKKHIVCLHYDIDGLCVKPCRSDVGDAACTAADHGHDSWHEAELST